MKKFNALCEAILNEKNETYYFYSNDRKDQHSLYRVPGGPSEVSSLPFEDGEETELRKQIEIAREALPDAKADKYFEIILNKEKPGWLIIGRNKNIVKTKDGYRVLNVSKNYKPDYGTFKTAKEAAETAIKTAYDYWN